MTFKNCSTVVSKSNHGSVDSSSNNNGIQWMEEIILQRLQNRQQNGTLRKLFYTTTNSTASTTTATTTIVPNNSNNDSNLSYIGNTNHSNDSDHFITSTSDNNNNNNNKNNDDTSDINSTRTTTSNNGNRIDFSSNDYLGLAHDIEQYHMVEQRMGQYYSQQQQQQQQQLNYNQQHDEYNQRCYTSTPLLGSTGSRLLSGDTKFIHDIENELCIIHHVQSTLLCSSGYIANLAVISTLPCTCILYDSHIHNSIHIGMRLWQQQQSVTPDNNNNNNDINNHLKIAVPFKHNDIHDLHEKLTYYSSTHNKNKKNTIAILIESVYSMDGDIAPIKDILDLALLYNSIVIVDEAHGFGIYGNNNNDKNNNNNNNNNNGTGIIGMNQCENHPALAIAIYTYGKAAGCHGAAICSPHSKVLKEYLINYAYPIIYSTSLPIHSIITIQCAYNTIIGSKGQYLRQHLYQLIEYFQFNMKRILDTLNDDTNRHPYRILPSITPIQALIVPGNDECTYFCKRLYQLSHYRIHLFPIKAPTVPIGQERIRIVLHSHNTIDQIDILLQCINQTLQECLHKNSRLTVISTNVIVRARL